MANVEKLSVVLKTKMVSLIRRCVEKGEYANSCELIRKAMRNLWLDGINSAPGKFADINAIKMEARKRLASSTK